MSIVSGYYVIDEDGFHHSSGRGRSARATTEPIDEFLVTMRDLACEVQQAPDEVGGAGSYAHDLATRFRALDDWLSSGRRRLPKSWWTTTAAQEPEGGA